MFEPGDGVDHTFVGHSRPSHSLHLLATPMHLFEVSGDGPGQLLLALLCDAPQLLLVLVDLVQVELDVLLQLAVFLAQHKDLLGR